MIATKFRIPRQEIPFILKKGESFKSALFIIRQVPNSEDFSRFRTIVSKKIHKLAVPRNKLRRQIYNALNEAMKIEQKNQQNHDIILIPQKKILNSSFEAIQKDITSIINGEIQ